MDTRRHLPGVHRREPGRPCSRGQIPVQRRRCGLSKHQVQAAPCQELPACQAAEEGTPWSHQPLGELPGMSCG